MNCTKCECKELTDVTTCSDNTLKHYVCPVCFTNVIEGEKEYVKPEDHKSEEERHTESIIKRLFKWIKGNLRYIRTED